MEVDCELCGGTMFFAEQDGPYLVLICMGCGNEVEYLLG